MSVDLASSIAVLGLLTGLGGIYGLRVALRGATAHERVAHAGASPLLGRASMEGAYWALGPLVSACVALGLSANAITLASLVLGLGAGVLLALGHFGLAAAVTMFSSLADALDGLVARKTQTASDAGEVVDAAVERYVELFFLGGLAVYFRAKPAALVLVLAAVLGSFMVSYSTAKAEALQIAPPRGAMRRAERAVVLFAGAALSPIVARFVQGDGRAWPMLAAVGLVAVVANVSAVRRLRALAASIRAAARAALRRRPSSPAQGRPAPRSARQRARHGSAPWTGWRADMTAISTDDEAISYFEGQRVHLRTVVPGPKSAAVRAREDALIAPGLQAYAVMAGIAVDHAQGSAVTDVDGNTFVDLIGGIGVGALGHAHPGVVRAITDQAARANLGAFTTEARVELCERLAEHAPAPGLTRLSLYSAGAEAVESALRLAKSHTGKSEFVSFWGGFHGKTMGVLSLMGSSFKDGLGPMVPGSHIVPYADCYRCPIGATHPTCGLGCVDVARKQIKMQSSRGVAGVVVEPIQGTSGNVVPPDEWLGAIADVAREQDALLIADEMITGFGRTGRYFGIEHAGVKPDIMTIGKAFGGGFPVSGLLTSTAVAEAKPWSNPSGSSSSYGGNPLAAAAAAAALRAIDDERLVERARRVGAAFMRELAEFVDDYPFVGHVRGKGLMIGMELVRDKATRAPLSRRVARFIFDACVQRGLLTMAYAPSFRLQPALTVDPATLREATAILREVFDLVREQRLWDAE